MSTINPVTKKLSTSFAFFPLTLFWLIYGLTCLLGAAIFYSGYRPYHMLVKYFAGITVPSEFTSSQNQALLVVFIIAPLAFSLGYGLVYRWYQSSAKRKQPLARPSLSPVYFIKHVWLVAFILLAVFGYGSLYRGGAFHRIDAWLDFSQWIASRLHLFQVLSFFELVNLYLLVPTAAAGLLLHYQAKTIWLLLLRLLPLAVVTSQQLLLFQKKSLLFALIVIFTSLLLSLYMQHGFARRLKKLSLLALLVMVVAYYAMVVTPIMNQVKQSLIEKPAASSETPATPRQRELNEIKAMIGEKDDGALRIMLAYSLLAPITRTSAPAIYYILVYPEAHPFYGLDVGLDGLGIGSNPDDMVVVWDAMYPNMPGGTMNAPFPFLFYSQIGAWGSVVASLLVGMGLALAWLGVMANDKTALAWRSLMGSLLILFAVYIAMDGVRISLIGNVGVLWPIVMVMALYRLYHPKA